MPQQIPVLLMVSGGSDSIALLELCCKYANPRQTTSFRLEPADSERTRLISLVGQALPPADLCSFSVLHINHMLRGEDSQRDEDFVVARCANLGIGCEVRHIDVASYADSLGEGLEAAARQVRYRAADEVLDGLCESLSADPKIGIICTAHTLDDRIETFYMRSLVGTGPGGLGSIPRVRGRVIRPLLDATREELRSWLRAKNPGADDFELWREDATNEDGSNFRSRVRSELIPVLRDLRPGFEEPLLRTMDLIAEEDAGLEQACESIVYRNVSWDGHIARMPVSALADMPVYLVRRILRRFLLIVSPQARIESAHIARICESMDQSGFSTDVSGGIRVRSDGAELCAYLA